MPKNLSTIRESDEEESHQEPLENFANGRPRIEPKNSLSEVVTQGKYKGKAIRVFKELENKVRYPQHYIINTALCLFTGIIRTSSYHAD